MKTYRFINLLALLALTLILPFYALREPQRMQTAQRALRQQQVTNGADLYLKYCSHCHGLDGYGNGTTPGLANPALAQAGSSFLYRTIARAEHGSTMAAWHLDEGGILNDYQIDELVTLIRFGDWAQVQQMAELEEIAPPELPQVDSLAYLESEALEDPHRCVACHEEPVIHDGLFGLNCARCHNADAWVPALLVQHTFPIDHGDQGDVACQVCHQDTYAANTCYGCHDHVPEDMLAVHRQEGISEYEACAECHPTGQPGEAGWLRQQQSDQKSSLNTTTFVGIGQ